MTERAWIADVLLCDLHADCDERGCDGRRTGTGRMRYDDLTRRWVVELRCPRHGDVVSWKPEYEAAIAAALRRSS